MKFATDSKTKPGVVEPSSPSALEDVIASINALEDERILLLASSRPLSKHEVFDVVADSGLHMSGWETAWAEAHSKTLARGLSSQSGEVREAAARAADIVAGAAVSRFLGNAMSNSSAYTLERGWNASINVSGR